MVGYSLLRWPVRIGESWVNQTPNTRDPWEAMRIESTGSLATIFEFSIGKWIIELWARFDLLRFASAVPSIPGATGIHMFFEGNWRTLNYIYTPSLLYSLFPVGNDRTA